MGPEVFFLNVFNVCGYITKSTQNEVVARARTTLLCPVSGGEEFKLGGIGTIYLLFGTCWLGYRRWPLRSERET